MPFWQAVTDNSQHLENQTKLQHSFPAPGTTGYPPNPMHPHAAQKYEAENDQVGANNTL